MKNVFNLSKTLLAFILLLIAIGGLGALAYQWRAPLLASMSFHNKILEQQEQQQIKLAAQIGKLMQQNQQQQTQIASLTEQVNKFAQNTGKSETWKLAEIVSLVRMANLQLTVQHDIKTALPLLKQAEVELIALNNPSLDAFHQALLKNIAQLQNVPQIDVAAIIEQLSVLQDQVPNLSILVAPKPNTSILAQTAHQANKKWWQRAWDNIKASFSQLVIVRHQQESIPALMAPDEQLYLQENLQLLIVQAQWALLHKQPNVYQESLKQAKAWIQKYYVQNSASTQQFLKQLNALQSVSIAPTLPDLTQTLRLVNQEIA